MSRPRYLIAGTLIAACLAVASNAAVVNQVVNTVAVGGITGLGTGVATALGINVGSAGAPVVLNGALGTPSSGTATNLTGLPIAGITGLGTNQSAFLGSNLTVNGALALNGSGAPSQAASTNLSDTTAATTWVPADASGASLSFSSVTANYSKMNRTCTGQFVLSFPSTANGTTAAISLPCTVPSGSSPAIGSCLSNALAPNSSLIMIGTNNAATATLWGTSAVQPTNANLTTALLSCNFGFVSQ